MAPASAGYYHSVPEWNTVGGGLNCTPEEFQQGGGLSCKLHKSLYGLKQAPRARHTALKAALVELGFVESRADSALFTKQTKVGLVGLIVYICG